MLTMDKIKNWFRNLYSGMKKISFSRMSIREQGLFIKRLSFLTKAGIPVLESLVMIKEQTRKKSHGIILGTVIHDVSNGQYLSTSLAKYHNMFGDFSINMISFGESAGILSNNLEYLADELKKRDALRKKIIGAFIYPAIVTLASIGITVFLIVYLFPKIMPVFSSLKMTLPLSTRIVIAISTLFQNYGLTIAFLVFALVITFFIILNKSYHFRFWFERFIMKVPIIGEMVKSYNLANSTRTLGLLLKSGITLSKALPIAAKSSENLVYKRELNNLSHVVDRGEKMSSYFAKKRHLFPDILSQIVAVGERSGNLSNSLLYLSDLYEAEVEDFTKNLSNLIEPALMIFMGVLVGFIAISIITPIYSITQNLHG